MKTKGSQAPGKKNSTKCQMMRWKEDKPTTKKMTVTKVKKEQAQSIVKKF